MLVWEGLDFWDSEFSYVDRVIFILLALGLRYAALLLETDLRCRSDVDVPAVRFLPASDFLSDWSCGLAQGLAYQAIWD